jgi:hypothetical protein
MSLDAAADKPISEIMQLHRFAIEILPGKDR